MPEEQAPRPSRLLYQNLFGRRRSSAETCALIADGLAKVVANARRLLGDAELMHSAGRLSTARFLITTAREEIAKAYVLADMCRLDFGRHESRLRRLCRAFYDHVAKHAYVEVLKFPVASMDQARSLWQVEITRWWPGSHEGSEPDMPHDTYFDREMPLYVDFGDQDQKWLLPSDLCQRAYFEPIAGRTPLSEALELIEPWEQAIRRGFCSPGVLATLNQVFSQSYIKESTSAKQLVALYRQVAEILEVDLGIERRDFEASPLHNWPLYHFVSEG